MNIMKRLTWRSMVKNRTRTIVTAIGIALAAALFCAVTTMGSSILSYLVDLQIAVGGDYHVSVTQQSPEDVTSIKENANAASAAQADILGVVNFYSVEFRAQSGMVLAGDSEFYAARPGLTLTQGRLAENSGEIAIDERLLEALADTGFPTELGSTLELPITPYIEALEQGDPDAEDFSYSVTLVGIVSDDVYSNGEFLPYYNGNLACIYTVLDENTPQAIYCDLYFKAITPYHATDLAKAVNGNPNYELLHCYGVSKARNTALAVLTVVAAVLAVILVGSVSMISNAFAISLTQRTKEFGLLSSVGATKKQLRKSVLTEALLLCLLGIPAGLLLGFGATALLLKRSGETVLSMIAVAKTGVTLTAVASPLAFLGAAAISAGTVFLSAWLPSKRATMITPLDAIRQANDCQPPKKAGKNAQKRWEKRKLSSNLARNYYNSNRKKYRSIVAALGISLVLFMTASGVSSVMGSVADEMGNTENFDFVVSVSPADSDFIDALRNHSSVSNSVVRKYTNFNPIILDSDESEERKTTLALDWLSDNGAADFWKSNSARMYYLEDDAFRAFLTELGIDPEPYFNPENPLAVVFYHETTIVTEVGDDWEICDVSLAPFAEGVTSIAVTPVAPDVVDWLEAQIKAQGYDFCFEQGGGYDFLEDGRMVYRRIVAGYNVVSEDADSGIQQLMKASKDQTFTFLAVVETGENGVTATNFYLYDEKTDTAGTEVIAQIVGNYTSMGIGAQVAEIPYGIPQDATNFCFLTLLRPLSMYQASETDSVTVCISTSDYQATLAFLNDPPEGMDVSYRDYLEEQYQMRQFKELIDLFSYAFVAVMILICMANVFNTVSTNILLRRKDFGMLRSLGMTGRDIRAMVTREILLCGTRALCWGLPLGFCLNVVVQSIIADMIGGNGALPWTALAVAAGTVCVVMGSGVLYGLSRIHKDNPIDAIRMENL